MDDGIQHGVDLGHRRHSLDSADLLMANASKRKGSAFERLIADYVSEVVPCERIPAGSSVDRSDLWTPPASIQCKAVAQLSLGAWMDATLTQQANAKKDWSWLVVKRRGVGTPERQFAICTVEQLRRVLDLLPHTTRSPK